MGAWGIGSFENDPALDWADQLIDQDADFIIETFEDVLALEDYIDVDDGSYAVAAAEVIAAVMGKPGYGLPDDITEWVANHPMAVDDELHILALNALDHVTENPDRSEMRGLWDESDDLQGWLAVIKDLRTRLTS